MTNGVKFTKLKHAYSIFCRFERKTVTWCLASTIIILIGIVGALLQYRQGIDMGDGSTFYAFAENLASGEAIYKDFIHFRTPGSYFLQAFFIELFGQQYTSLNFALKFEAYVLYPALFFLALAILFNKRRLLFSFALSLSTILLPAYLQARAALAFLAAALYVRSLTGTSYKRWLLLTGVVGGLTFSFGQETGVIVFALVGINEVIIGIQTQMYKKLITRLSIFAVGVITGLVPLMGYIIMNSDLVNAVYYIFYYAFILQPQGMDLPFPPLAHETFIYFMPFLIYIVAALTVFLNKLDNARLIFGILLAFVALRMVSFLGRTDMGHLVFIIPELILLLFVAIASIKNINKKLSFGDIVASSLYILALVAIFIGATRISTIFIVTLVPLVILSRYIGERIINLIDKDKSVTLNPINILCGAIGGVSLLFLYMLVPTYNSNINAHRSGITKNYTVGTFNYEGSFVTKDQYQEIQHVKAAITLYDPEYIFSFPVQPFYYRFAPEHAAKYMTYEPQTTDEEQNSTITSLKKYKPEIVIFDPLQVPGLSGSVDRISAYIQKNYKVVDMYYGNRTLWIMTPLNSSNSFDLNYSENNNAIQSIGVDDDSVSIQR